MTNFPGINQQLGVPQDQDDEDLSKMMQMASNPNADDRMAIYKNNQVNKPTQRSIKDFFPSQDEMDALNSPSIMDKYIKENDPRQYDRIQQANNIQGAIDLGSSTALGAIGKKPNDIQVDKWEQLRRETDPNFGKMDQIINAIPTQDQNFQRLTPEQIQQFRDQINTPHNEEQFFDKLKRSMSGQ